MTRKVTIAALIGAIAALLLTAGGAAAATAGETRTTASSQQIRAAAFPALTPRTARGPAVRLARLSARDRHARWWTLSKPVSVSRSRIVFVYSDRSRNNVFCTAEIVVVQPSPRLRRTRFTSGDCNGVPSEALAVEQTTSRLLRAARTRALDLAESIGGFNEELADCEEVRVPRSRRDDVRRLFLAREAVASIRPLASEIGAFVVALQDLRLQRPGLARGVEAWDEFDSAVAGLATITSEARRPCAAVRRWSRAGWSSDAAPAPLESLRLTLESARSAERAIERSAAELARLGVSPRVVLGFTPAGLVAASVPPRVCGFGCAG